MADEDELALTSRVAGELARLGLTKHVAKLRTYFVDVRAGRPSTAWTHEMSVEWLRLLRLPPHENDYPGRVRVGVCLEERKSMVGEAGSSVASRRSTARVWAVKAREWRTRAHPCRRGSLR